MIASLPLRRDSRSWLRSRWLRPAQQRLRGAHCDVLVTLGLDALLQQIDDAVVRMLGGLKRQPVDTQRLQSAFGAVVGEHSLVVEAGVALVRHLDPALELDLVAGLVRYLQHLSFFSCLIPQSSERDFIVHVARFAATRTTTSAGVAATEVARLRAAAVAVGFV